MRYTETWEDYQLLDTSRGEKLETWGNVVLIRPDPQIIWNTPRTDPRWRTANARYLRTNTGGGSWEVYHAAPEIWSIGYGDLKFNIKTMGFKHTGLFPEQAVNWELLDRVIRNSGRELKVLNLFAYTGGATLAALNAGAHVTHVDASKGMVTWARENAVLSRLSDRPVRWLVDDCIKFVKREIRRGNKYDIIIMDPPSYGRGPNGEIWKLEDQIYEFTELCAQLLSEEPVMFILNSYTTGLSPSVMEYILKAVVSDAMGGHVESDEIGLPVVGTDKILPCGATSIWFGDASPTVDLR